MIFDDFLSRDHGYMASLLHRDNPSISGFTPQRREDIDPRGGKCHKAWRKGKFFYRDRGTGFPVA